MVDERIEDVRRKSSLDWLAALALPSLLIGAYEEIWKVTGPHRLAPAHQNLIAIGLLIGGPALTIVLMLALARSAARTTLMAAVSALVVPAVWLYILIQIGRSGGFN